jgi:hypothetical protein
MGNHSNKPVRPLYPVLLQVYSRVTDKILATTSSGLTELAPIVVAVVTIVAAIFADFSH